MASWTADELATKTLIELGVVGAGQSAAAEDAAEVKERWESVHAQLQKDLQIPFGDGTSTADIPAWAQEPLQKYMAWKCAALFLGTSVPQTIVAGGGEGYRELQSQMHGGKKHARVRSKSY